MRLFLVSATVVTVGFASAEALVRIAVDTEPSSYLQQVVFRSALGALIGSLMFFAGLVTWMRRSRRREPPPPGPR